MSWSRVQNLFVACTSWIALFGVPFGSPRPQDCNNTRITLVSCLQSEYSNFENKKSLILSRCSSMGKRCIRMRSGAFERPRWGLPNQLLRSVKGISYHRARLNTENYHFLDHPSSKHWQSLYFLLLQVSPIAPAIN